MPKKIDDEVQARAVPLVTDHLSEYPSLTAAAATVARQVGGLYDGTNSGPPSLHGASIPRATQRPHMPPRT